MCQETAFHHHPYYESFRLQPNNDLGACHDMTVGDSDNLQALEGGKELWDVSLESHSLGEKKRSNSGGRERLWMVMALT